MRIKQSRIHGFVCIYGVNEFENRDREREGGGGEREKNAAQCE